MSSKNRVNLLGNLGRDPEVRYMPDGTPTATISLATSEAWTDKNGERKEHTEWHRVVFYRGLAEVVGKYLHEGAKVDIEGKLRTRKWTDKDGIDRWSTEIIAKEMRMLGGKRKPEARQADGQRAAADVPKGKSPSVGFDDGPYIDDGQGDDIPF